ncbi:MAG: glycoside hydrolase family 43 protein [Candidatus Solibacter sp.]
MTTGTVLRFTVPLTLGVVAAQTPLINPLLPSGADPWVTSHGGYYYYMNTTGNSLAIRRVRNMADLAQSESRVVWRPPASGPYSRDIWAPELHFLRGKWYIYFAADSGTNASHRLWVLENDSEDPRAGEWRMKGKVSDATDRWAIDATVFEEGSRLYMVWSGWEGEVNGAQNLYLAELSDPWTVKGPRVRISAPDLPWERVGDLKPRRDPEENPGLNQMDPLHVDVNEGPEILRHGNRIFVVYSAGGCWTDYYSMGMLTAEVGSDLLKAASWKKSPVPVFWQSPKVGAYGTGHGSFFTSPDGSHSWMLYHANPEAGQGCGRQRSPRAQPFTWKSDGMPDFGRPVAIGTPLPRPQGQ